MGQISLGHKADGKRNRPTVYGKVQKEVREKLFELKQQSANGTLSTTKLTLKGYLEHWIKEKARELKPRSTHDYRYNIEHYIVPRIGRLRLDKLTPLQVQMMMGEIDEDVSADRANKCRSTLRNALGQAVRWQLISRNPVEAVNPLKYEREEMQLWTPEQAAHFLDTAMEHRLYALFYLAMCTGLRSCELIGLRWQDVKGSTLHIRQTIVKVGAKQIVETPKSKKGNRRVAITPDVIDVLEQHRKRQDAERHFLGEAGPTQSWSLRV